MTSFSGQTLDMVHDVSETIVTKLIGTGYYDAPTIQKSLQGSALAISQDALTMAIGGPDNDQGIGCVWVYTRIDLKSEWIGQGNKIRGSNYSGKSRQGSSISLSDNGNILAFGGPADDNNTGAIWVFERIGGAWYENSKVAPAFDGAPPNYGTSVAVSGDGLTIAFGGPNRNYYQSSPTSGNVPIGIVWICGLKYIESLGKEIYIYETGLVGRVRDGYKSRQGSSVSLSHDGKTLAIGGYEPDPLLKDAFAFGEVFVFVKKNKMDPNSWSEQEHEVFFTPDQPNSLLGRNVCLSSDGNTLIVGGFYYKAWSGCSWLFIRDINNKWIYDRNFLAGIITPYTNEKPSHTSSLSKDGRIVCIAHSYDLTKDTVVTVKEKYGTSEWRDKGDLIFPQPIIPFIKNGFPALISGNGKTVIFGIASDNQGIGSTRCYTFANDMYKEWIRSRDIICPDFTGRPHQGYAIAITKDGMNMAVGGPDDNDGTGSVWFYTKDPNTSAWIQKGEKLLPPDHMQKSNFGYSLAMSTAATAGTDDILVIGGPGDNDARGAAWVYRYKNNLWTYEQKLIDNHYNPNARYGSSVAISDTNRDMSIIAVGGPNSVTYRGSVAAFKKMGDSGNQWNQIGDIIISLDPAAMGQGASVSLSADGKTLAIGCPAGVVSCTAIFNLSAENSWVQKGDILVGVASSYVSQQGSCLSINSSGDLLVVGAHKDDNANGAIFTFRLINNSWVQLSKLVEKRASDGSMYGHSVFLADRADGVTYLSVGSPKDSDGKGAIWVYKLVGDNWNPVNKNRISGILPNGFANCGSSVSMSSDLKTLAFGGSEDDNGNVGAAWVACGGDLKERQ